MTLDNVTMLDFTLPVVTLPEVSDLTKVQEKYREELREWAIEPEGSLDKIIELWDVLQVCETWMRNGGGPTAIECYSSARRTMDEYRAKGLPVMGAKAFTLKKNAQRGYYSPEDCRRILEEGATC